MGAVEYRCDSSSVSSELQSGVTQIFSTSNSYAALKRMAPLLPGGFRILTWLVTAAVSAAAAIRRHPDFLTRNAFAALKEDGLVVTWGDSDGGQRCES